MGTGITASAVERQRNAYYDTKYWSANSKYSQYNSQHANLEQLQTYMNEMTSEAGYTKWMAEMSDAMQDLSTKPADYTTRISFALTADSFTDMVNELASNFQSTQKTINDEVELAVSEVNSLAKQIYELTQEIITVELRVEMQTTCVISGAYVSTHYPNISMLMWTSEASCMVWEMIRSKQMPRL